MSCFVVLQSLVYLSFSFSFFGRFSSAFSFTDENEKCIFGRPLHQTVSDSTIRQWFSDTQQSCKCLEKLVYPPFLTQVILHHHRRRRRRRVVRVNHCAAPWPLAISDLHSVDSSRTLALAYSWVLNLVEPGVARATRRSSLAGHCLSAFVGIHHQTQCIIHVKGGKGSGFI